MKLSVPVLTLWAALLGTLALALSSPHQALAPGHLVDAHSAIERDCLACHTLGRGVPSGRCVACHALEQIGQVTTKGAPIVPRPGKTLFHRQLRQVDCLTCHTEHVGPTGDSAPRGFAHSMIDSASRRECATCHSVPTDTIHRGITTSCASCHTMNAWKPATFAHEKFFPLDRNHATPCMACHPGNAFARYTCYGCHEHSLARMQSKHAEEGIRDLADCIRCHKSPSDHGEGGEGRRRTEGRTERGGDDR